MERALQANDILPETKPQALRRTAGTKVKIRWDDPRKKGEQTRNTHKVRGSVGWHMQSPTSTLTEAAHGEAAKGAH